MPDVEKDVPRTGVERIAAERWRQISQEGYSPQHDAEHDNDALAWAAACYAAPERVYLVTERDRGVSWAEPWPAHWRRDAAFAGDRKLHNRQSRIRELEKAGALIAAEIDRLTRMPGVDQ
jgi:hypothetical protein